MGHGLPLAGTSVKIRFRRASVDPTLDDVEGALPFVFKMAESLVVVAIVDLYQHATDTPRGCVTVSKLPAGTHSLAVFVIIIATSAPPVEVMPVPRATVKKPHIAALWKSSA
jgi:hypothetical protein